ncbi:hypothetical protein JOE57_000005 [Microlunatus panaciterrae]|uniref:Uncharacterized protein n=1 Tax=Microlunatus panaciterrae TaxID=400768 RepID=A0ABS2RDL5_9ACTN|nr:hypothetical protein [Microlunatus panaciterrae]MBM7797084.1 hypothetical protein [Microlunatus panaciterrae]
MVVLMFVLLPCLVRPLMLRSLRRLAERTEEWMAARAARIVPVDPEQEKLWLWSKRCRLSAALSRIERLLATDEHMSATRQLGNRLAHDQLVDELRRVPDVFPSGAYAPTIDVWQEPVFARRWQPSVRERRDPDDRFPAWSVTVPVGYASKPGEVEVLDIVWSRRR